MNYILRINKDAVASIPKLFKEKDQKIQDLVQINEQLNEKLEAKENSQPEENITVKKSVRFAETVKLTLNEQIPENVTVENYVQSVCNNKKLAREIRETLQILLMKEKSEITQIKEKADAPSREIDIDVCKKLEDTKNEVVYLKNQIEEINKLKIFLEEQLNDEYKENEELRNENRDISDELMVTKESVSKLEIELLSYKSQIERLNRVKEWLTEVVQKALQTSVNGIKGKLTLHQTIENTVKGILGNTLQCNQILKDDRNDYMQLIDQLNNEKMELEEQNQKLMDIDKDAHFETKVENIQRLYEKSKTDILYFENFVKKVKSLIQQIDPKAISKIDPSVLDTVYTSLVEYIQNIKNDTVLDDDSKLAQENLQLRELVSIQSDRYEKIISNKKSLINNLQTMIETSIKNNNQGTDSPEYRKLKELKEKDQISYEGEIKALKQNIVNMENAKQKEIVQINKLKFEIKKLTEQIKTLGDVHDKNQTLEENSKQLETTNYELKQSLDQLQVEMKIKSQRYETKIESSKKEYEEKVEKLNNELSSQKQELDKLSEQIKSVPSQSQPKSDSNMAKNFVRVFNMLKKSKKLLEIRENYTKNTPEVENAPKPQKSEPPVTPTDPSHSDPKPTNPTSTATKPSTSSTSLPTKPTKPTMPIKRPSTHPSLITTPTAPSTLTTTPKPPVSSITKKRDLKHSQKQQHEQTTTPSIIGKYQSNFHSKPCLLNPSPPPLIKIYKHSHTFL